MAENTVKTILITKSDLETYDTAISGKYATKKELENTTKITVDSALSSTSTNPVQNKVINEALGNCVKSGVNQVSGEFKLQSQGDMTFSADGDSLTLSARDIVADGVLQNAAKESYALAKDIPTKPSDIGAAPAPGNSNVYLALENNGNDGTVTIGSSGFETINFDSVDLKKNGSEVATQDWVDSNEVFEKGSANNSGVLKGSYDGHSNKALSQISLAMGAASTAGLKGWYYNKVNFNSNRIFLTKTRPILISSTNQTTATDSSFNSGYAVGDIISIVNDSKYEYCSRITAISGNMLTLDSLPFTSSNWTTTNLLGEPDEFSVYCINYSYDSDTKTLTISKHDVGGVDFGGGALAEGIHTYALNLGAHAEGIQTVVFGQYGHAEGFRTQAAYAAHAEGKESEARGSVSHAEGANTRAIGNGTHTEGYRTVSKGQGAHAEGHSASLPSDTTIAGDSTTIVNAWNTNKFTLAKGTASHAEGKDTLALGNHSHSEGQQTIAQGSHSHAEGKDTKAAGQGSHAEGENTSATASRTHAEGSNTSATANNAHAEGMNGIASGNSAHAEGVNTIAGPAEGALAVNTNTEAGNFAHAEGNGTWASGNSAHAEGKKTTASGPYSHAEGYSTTASGNKGHAEGHVTQATGDSAHAEGQNTIASHAGSHAGGCQTRTSKNYQTVVGQYNADNTNAYLIVGRGSADARANAFEAGYNSANGDFIKVGTEILTASKLAAIKNPADLTFGSKTYDGQKAMTITAADLGLSGAMKFLGTSTTTISDGLTTKTITVSGSNITVSAGNVVLYDGHEYVWTGSAWEQLGQEGSFKVKQSAVTSPTTSGSTTAFIDTISQDENGNITATKKNVSFPVTSVNGNTGAVQITIPTKTSDLTNDSDYVTFTQMDDQFDSELAGYATTKFVEDKGYQTAAQVQTIKVNNATNADKLGGFPAIDYVTYSGLSDSFDSELAKVATTGSYEDLSDKPTIPDVSNYLPKSGGTMTGSIITPKDDNMGIIPHTNNYGQIGSSDKRFFRMYASTFYGDINGGYFDGEDSYYDLIHSGNISSQSVLSANKLATARTINGVSFDGSSNITIYSPYECVVNTAKLTTPGWYRVASISSLGTCNTLEWNLSRNYSNTNSEAYQLLVSMAHQTCNFTQINSKVNITGITKVRLVYLNHSSVAYLEVYYSLNVENNIYSYIRGNAATGIGWTNVAFTAGTIPSGYSSKEFTLSSNSIKADSFEGTLVGNATSATNATNDGNGKNIANTYLPKSGDTLTGNLSLTETKNILLRPSNTNYTAGIGYDTDGNECIALWAKNSVTRLRWHAGTDMTSMTAGTMMGITPDFEVDKSSGSVVGRLGGNTIIHSGNIGSQSVASATKATNSTVTTANHPSGTTYLLPFVTNTGDVGLSANDGIGYWTREGTTSSPGVGELKLGNPITSGTAGNKKGMIYMYGSSSGYTEITPSNNTTSNVIIHLPSTAGTLALTSQVDGKVSKSGDTMSGKLRVNAPIFGYNYTNDEDGNIASFIFDKPGSHFTGIGSNGETDTIYFGAVSSSDTGVWNNDYKQKWKFNGSIIADSITGNLTGNASSATKVNGVIPEWQGSVANGDTNWIAAWTSDGTKIKALDKRTLSVNYATTAGSAPASDVYSWAKKDTKPSYTASEVGAVPTTRTVNSKALSSNITLTADDVGAIAINGGNVLGDIAFDLEDDCYFKYNGSEVATHDWVNKQDSGIISRIKTLEDDVELIKEQIACFRGDTQILMADGSTKDIKDVEYGDMIKSYDIENDCLVDVKSYGAYATGFEQFWNVTSFTNGSVLYIATDGHYLYHPLTQKLVMSENFPIRGKAYSSNGDKPYLVGRKRYNGYKVEKRYELISENGLFFANDILAGHAATSTFHHYKKGHLPLTEEEASTVEEDIRVYIESDMGGLDNPDFLKECGKLLMVVNKRKEKIEEFKNRLAKMDYKQVKWSQGKLSELDYKKYLSECETWRACINESEVKLAEEKNQLKEARERFGIKDTNRREQFLTTHHNQMRRIKERQNNK